MEAVATHTGLTPAGLSATLLLAAAHAHRAHSGIRPMVVVVEPPSRAEDALIEELAALRSSLARIGNNLNQIARVLNSGILPDAQVLVRDLESGLGRLASAVAAADSAAHRAAKR
ncbi:MobC family plasmid mobilization relaxosome protein [Yinghuangia sp. ASG 101]|uniref:MobC family plasmid mobilization relaxosome protein n=1 Tax=Yinghuangia sp. ASG 101 TaxID=2896848 RepID=UPI001E418F8E|nr:MobC family plasmid mobilization relaxosome protein [Yinghuangia sp. ASG 101]UGQ10965.1 MobC family plasmid mobilization relaxosome protein [Yinghuangia sp. ASG 101]